MHLSHLHLRQYRSYQDRSFDFSPGVTIITGPNGSGKTNILESIYLLSHGSSFRDGDELLTAYTKDWWRVSGVVDTRKREVRYDTGKKSFHYENEVRGRFSSAHRLPVVLFEPDDLLLVHGSPGKRRHYIDTVISMTTPRYMTTVRRYERALAQRNRLLKQTGQLDQDQLFVWDLMLAEAAAVIVTLRRSLVDEYNHMLGDTYSYIADCVSAIEVRYQTTVDAQDYTQQFLSTLKQQLPRDRLVGFTSVGPHRDDIEFFLNDKSMTSTASRGEVRSLLLALKQFEVRRLERYFSTAPLLLLDDVFSEMDADRQEKVVGLTEGQCIITATHTIQTSDTPSIIAL